MSSSCLATILGPEDNFRSSCTLTTRIKIGKLGNLIVQKIRCASPHPTTNTNNNDPNPNPDTSLILRSESVWGFFLYPCKKAPKKMPSHRTAEPSYCRNVKLSSRQTIFRVVTVLGTQYPKQPPDIWHTHNTGWCSMRALLLTLACAVSSVADPFVGSKFGESPASSHAMFPLSCECGPKVGVEKEARGTHSVAQEYNFTKARFCGSIYDVEESPLVRSFT